MTSKDAEQINAIEDRAARLEAAGFHQTTVADFLGLTSEEAQRSVSLDLMVRALLAVGATRADIARALGT